MGCDVPPGGVLRATAMCFGVWTCVGARTLMVGSKVPEPVAACEVAVPPMPHDSAIDKMAAAGPATKTDEDLIATSSTAETDIREIKMQQLRLPWFIDQFLKP